MPEQSLADDPRLDSILRGVEIFKAREAAKPSLIDHPDLASVLRGVEICQQRERQREDLVGRRARELGVAPEDLYERFRRKKHPPGPTVLNTPWPVLGLLHWQLLLLFQAALRSDQMTSRWTLLQLTACLILLNLQNPPWKNQPI